MICPKQEKIVQLVHDNPGIKSRELIDEIYGDRPISENIISVLIVNINRKLSPMGMKIKGKPGRMNGGYWLVQI